MTVRAIATQGQTEFNSSGVYDRSRNANPQSPLPLVVGIAIATPQQTELLKNPNTHSPLPHYPRGSSEFPNPHSPQTAAAFEAGALLAAQPAAGSQNANARVTRSAAAMSSALPPAPNPPAQIDIDAIADKVERKLMRQLAVESERRGQKQWH